LDRSPSPFDLAPTTGRTTTGAKTMQELLTSVNSIVKNRTGTVLSRQTILKSDHFDTGKYIMDYHVLNVVLAVLMLHCHRCELQLGLSLTRGCKFSND
jgi:hypothetical protein